MTAEAAIARQVARRLWRQALAVGATSGAVAASSAVTYASTYPTVAERARIAAKLQGNAGFSVLFGQLDRIGSIGGYTAYKGYVFLTTIGAVWAALAVTRRLRGEEDAGRWAILLAGCTTPRRATAATLGGIVVAVAGALVVAVALVAATSTKPSLDFGEVDAVWFGASLAIPTLVFAAVGAVASQLARSRRLASWLALGTLAVAFVVRMVADAGPRSHWLLWATPLGWAEQVHPFTANDPWPLVPAVVSIGVLVVLALALAGRRDVGGGALATADTSPVRPRGLGAPWALSARLERPALVAWAAGVAATSLVFGLVAKAAVDGVASSDSAGRVLDRLGASGGGADQYLGVVFLLVGAVLALVPAGQVAAARDEEASGRLAYLLAGPASRTRWLGGRLAVAGGAVVAIGVLSGLATWAGAASQGLRVGVASTVLAGLNVVPAALLSLALGAVALAVVPRAAPASVYVVVAWSLVVDLVGTLVSGLRPLTRLSIFHWVALAPSVPPNWAALAAVTALAVALGGGAIAAFARRDLGSA